MEFRTIKYPDNVIHIDRWMCPCCGMIFDFLPDLFPDGLGWTSYDPPLDHVDHWVDKDGNYHETDIERNEICPRCECDLSETPLQRVFVSATTSISDIEPIIKQGEGVTTEFKKIFPKPKDGHKLAKEIAAFATTQGGRIFLGVNDAGEIVGLQGIGTPLGRDSLQKSIRRVVGRIDPKVSLSVDFISNQDTHIALISIQKGKTPFCSINGTVYIRDLDSSRPATSEEIKSLVTHKKKTK